MNQYDAEMSTLFAVEQQLLNAAVPLRSAERRLAESGFKQRVVSIPGGPKKVLAQFPGHERGAEIAAANERVAISAMLQRFAQGSHIIVDV